MPDRFFAFKRHLLPTAALALLASGCASPPDGVAQASVASAGTAETVVCSREEGTGSPIASTRCRKGADVESRRTHDREMAEKIATVVPDIR